MCLGARLKKATSDPEIMAEKKSKMTTTTIPVMAPGVIGINTACRKREINAGSKPGVNG
jgi:hypothetical protein